VSQDEEFATFVAARSRALMRTAYLLTGDLHQAEDLLQTALAKLYVHWGRVREREALDAYVRTTMTRAHISWLRRAASRERPLDVFPDSPAPSGPDVETRDALWALLGTLPRRQRAVLVLRFYEDLSERETADILGCGVGTVKSQTSRALAKLRLQLPGPDAMLVKEETA
jgi:RNA polymerase sigma-70 factor (sigma-E family)